MPRELKKTIDQTKDVEGQIRSALQSRLKRDILWIVTESDYDRTVYEQFFNDNVAVKPSYDERGDGGCDRVMRIVESIRKKNLTQRIIGIRDADYQYFLPQRFVYPDYVKHTDQRDIEMMMLTSPSVQNGLAAWNPGFTAKLEQVKPVVCYLGRIRIWHIAHNITASIKKLKLPKVWDYTSIPQRLKNGWKRILTDQYNRLTGEDINPNRLSALKKRYALDDLEYGHICRGHDFVQLLGIAMVDTRFSSDKIETKLGELYSKADFSGTNLAQNIRAFAAGYGLVVM